MKKNKFTLVLMIAALMSAAIIIMGCRIGCPGTGMCSWDSAKKEGSMCMGKDVINASDVCDVAIQMASDLYNGSSKDGKCDC